MAFFGRIFRGVTRLGQSITNAIRVGGDDLVTAKNIITNPFHSLNHPAETIGKIAGAVKNTGKAAVNVAESGAGVVQDAAAGVKTVSSNPAARLIPGMRAVGAFADRAGGVAGDVKNMAGMGHAFFG